jgi:hypothetical protein
MLTDEKDHQMKNAVLILATVAALAVAVVAPAKAQGSVTTRMAFPMLLGVGY